MILILDEKGKSSLLLCARSHVDVYAMVILQPEPLASFQVEVYDAYNEEINYGCYQYVINAILATGIAIPLLISYHLQKES